MFALFLTYMELNPGRVIDSCIFKQKMQVKTRCGWTDPYKTIAKFILRSIYSDGMCNRAMQHRKTYQQVLTIVLAGDILGTF